MYRVTIEMDVFDATKCSNIVTKPITIKAHGPAAPYTAAADLLS